MGPGPMAPPLARSEGSLGGAGRRPVRTHSMGTEASGGKAEVPWLVLLVLKP